MQWDASPNGGFTTGEPWLPAVDPVERNVEAQRTDPDSLLNFYRWLIARRRILGEGFRMLDAAPGVVAYERGEHLVEIHTAGEGTIRRLGE
jgi:glycosidase